MAPILQQNLSSTAWQPPLSAETGVKENQSQSVLSWAEQIPQSQYEQPAGQCEKAHAGAADSILICTWWRRLLLEFSHKQFLVWPENPGLMKRKSYCVYKQQHSELQC